MLVKHQKNGGCNVKFQHTHKTRSNSKHDISGRKNDFILFQNILPFLTPPESFWTFGLFLKKSSLMPECRSSAPFAPWVICHHPLGEIASTEMSVFLGWWCVVHWWCLARDLVNGHPPNGNRIYVGGMGRCNVC